jgi:hypothetical protein
MYKYLVLSNYGDYEGWTRDIFDTPKEAINCYKQNVSSVIDCEIYKVIPLELALKEVNQCENQ